MTARPLASAPPRVAQAPIVPLALARVGLFEGLPQSELEQLAALVRQRRYRRGVTIFREGDPGAALYLIESGQVRIGITSEDGKELVIALLGPGDFFGDLALLDGAPHSADAFAREDCSLLLLQRSDFQRYLASRPEIANHLLGVLSRRLRRNTQMLQEAAFLDVSARVASALLQLADLHGQPDGEAITITSQFKQSELAAMVGASRESVNKWLRYYERIGLVRSSGRSLTILQPDQLRRRLS
ncbi:MAG TPA: Crp/Fnr family transcriptional regulator [Chloroflexota bacterium]|nr:Crp/Fnr family transcriptional regulator [Chloroflexota bacterium]